MNQDADPAAAAAGSDAGVPAAPLAAKVVSQSQASLLASCCLCGAEAKRPLTGNLKFLCLNFLRAGLFSCFMCMWNVADDDHHHPVVVDGFCPGFRQMLPPVALVTFQS